MKRNLQCFFVTTFVGLFVEMRNAAPITHALDGAVLHRVNLSRNQVAGALGTAVCLRTLAHYGCLSTPTRARSVERILAKQGDGWRSEGRLSTSADL